MRVTDVWPDYFLTIITRVNTINVVMWETQLSIVDWGNSKTLTLWQSNICHHQLDVQEANFSLTHVYRI